MAHSFIELDKADWLVFCDCGFQSVCPLMENDKRLLDASWWERLTEQPTLVMYLHSSARSGEVGNLMNAFLFCPKQVASGFKPSYPSQTKKKKKTAIKQLSLFGRTFCEHLFLTSFVWRTYLTLLSTQRGVFDISVWGIWWVWIFFSFPSNILVVARFFLSHTGGCQEGWDWRKDGVGGWG